MYRLTRTFVAQLATARASALAAELLGEVLLGDLGKELLLVVAAQNVDLGDSDGVEELLDNAESARETPRSVDDVKLAQSLGVVVLRDGRGLLEVSVCAAHHADADTLEVHDRA